jgi:hypothetical protein
MTKGEGDTSRDIERLQDLLVERKVSRASPHHWALGFDRNGVSVMVAIQPVADAPPVLS